MNWPSHHRRRSRTCQSTWPTGPARIESGCGRRVRHWRPLKKRPANSSRNNDQVWWRHHVLRSVGWKWIKTQRKWRNSVTLALGSRPHNLFIWLWKKRKCWLDSKIVNVCWGYPLIFSRVASWPSMTATCSDLSYMLERRRILGNEQENLWKQWQWRRRWCWSSSFAPASIRSRISRTRRWPIYEKCRPCAAIWPLLPQTYVHNRLVQLMLFGEYLV